MPYSVLVHCKIFQNEQTTNATAFQLKEIRCIFPDIQMFVVKW